MKLLAVEPRQWGTYQVPRYEKAERLGHQVYLLAGEGGDPSTWPAERYRMLGSKRLPDLIEAARAWHAEEGFDGVFTFSEMAVIADRATSRARSGLPGIGAEAALHQPQQAADAPGARARRRAAPALPLRDRTGDEALAAAEEFGYPAIIKPTLGGGQRLRVPGRHDPRSWPAALQQPASGINRSQVLSPTWKPTGWTWAPTAC